MASWINSFLFTLGFILMLASLVANVLVIFALTFRKGTRIPAFNILIIGQMAISMVDIVCNMPLTITSALRDHFPLEGDPGGFHLCRFHSFFIFIVQTTRIVLTALMALDRVVAIYSPINYPERITKERACCMIFYCWFHGAAVYISMAVGATPVKYRKHHYSCLIDSFAPESYVVVMVTFGFVIPVALCAAFLLMILKKYVVQEPVVSAMATVRSHSLEYCSDSTAADGRTSSRKRNKGSHRSMTDFEISAYVSFLYLIWLLCQCPLFVTLTSDLILSENIPAEEVDAVVRNQTVFDNVTASQNITGGNTTIVHYDDDQYSKMFPPALQTVVQFLNFLPSLLIPILTFVFYRSVWSRLRHIIIKSRIARKRRKLLSVEDENPHPTYLGQTFIKASTATRRQRSRHRSRTAVDTSEAPDANISGIDNGTVDVFEAPRATKRVGTPVLMATSNGLLLHQYHTRPANDEGNGVFVVDENGFFETSGGNESDIDNGNNDSDAMTFSGNSTKHLIQKRELFKLEKMDTIEGSLDASHELPHVGDSGIEDSPMEKMKSENVNNPSNSEPFSFQTPQQLPTSASIIKPLISSTSDLATAVDDSVEQVPDATSSNINVNAAVRRFLGSASPKTKYKASVFTVGAPLANLDSVPDSRNRKNSQSSTADSKVQRSVIVNSLPSTSACTSELYSNEDYRY